MSESQPVSVTILDKEYLIACTNEEREQLQTAVSFLNMKMQEVKNSGKVIGSERVAVMTALNIAHELLAHKHENENLTSNIDDTIERLRSKIDRALTHGRQLEM